MFVLVSFFDCCEVGVLVGGVGSEGGDVSGGTSGLMPS